LSNCDHLVLGSTAAKLNRRKTFGEAPGLVLNWLYVHIMTRLRHMCKTSCKLTAASVWAALHPNRAPRRCRRWRRLTARHGAGAVPARSGACQLLRQPPRRTQTERHAVAGAGAASQPVTVLAPPLRGSSTRQLQRGCRQASQPCLPALRRGRGSTLVLLSEAYG
jgi:hypothetical protein